MPDSGPVSALAAYGKVERAFFQNLNAKGGIDGRAVELITKDDGYLPNRTVESVRELTEKHQVLAIFGSLGAATNSAVRGELNRKKIPHLFLATAAKKFFDPSNCPWSMGILSSFEDEAATYARFLIRNRPDARVGILSQQDDLGSSYLKGFEAALKEERAEHLLVSTLTYIVTDPTVDQQVFELKSAGVDVLFLAATPKHAAMALRRILDMGWKPAFIFLAFPASSIGTTVKSVSAERLSRLPVYSLSPLKDPNDPRLQNDADVREYMGFMRSALPDLDPADQHNVLAYVSSHLMTHVLKACSKTMDRMCIMDKATSMTNVPIPLMLPGVSVSTSKSRYQQVNRLQMRRLTLQGWEPVDSPIALSSSEVTLADRWPAEGRCK